MFEFAWVIILQLFSAQFILIFNIIIFFSSLYIDLIFSNTKYIILLINNMWITIKISIIVTFFKEV